MKRRTKPSYRGSRNFSPENSSAYRDRRVPLLGSLGMSVFRRAENDETLHAVEVFKKYTRDHYFRSARGEKGHAEPAISQLAINEVQRVRQLREVPIQEAINHVYYCVPSLKQRKLLTVEGVTILSANQTTRPVCLTFIEEDSDFLNTERQNILESLEDLGEGDYGGYDWNRRFVPHITLGRIATNTPRYEQAKLRDDVFEQISTEVQVSRATLHNPSS